MMEEGDDLVRMATSNDVDGPDYSDITEAPETLLVLTGASVDAPALHSTASVSSQPQRMAHVTPTHQKVIAKKIQVRKIGVNVRVYSILDKNLL